MSVFGFPVAVPGGSGGGGGIASEECINPLKAPYNAKGDGTTDDIAALEAAATAAATKGLPICLETPKVAYGISRPWQPPPGITIQGTATALGQCAIRALQAMTAVVILYTTDNTTLGTKPVRISGVTFDANNLADYGYLRNGDWLSTVKTCFAVNALLDGRHANGHRTPVTIGAVTRGGGATAGFTVSQRDPGYIGIASGTVVVKATGASTFVMSTDGGVTFCTFLQDLIANATIGLMNATFSTPTSDTGLIFNPGPGPFANDMTWSFPVTVHEEQTGNTQSVNVETVHDDVWCDSCGTVPVEAGTVSVTVGSIVVTGSGCSWMSGKKMRPGDSITITLNGIAGPGTTQATFPIMGVGHNNKLYLYPQEGVMVQASGAALAYKRNIGWGAYDDDSGDMVRNFILFGRITNCANGIRLTGDSGGGQMVTGIRIEQPSVTLTGISLLLGGVLQGAQDHILIAPEMKAGGGCRVYCPFGSGALLLGPHQSLSVGLPSDFYGSWGVSVFSNGMWARYAPIGAGGSALGGSSMPIGALSLAQSVVQSVTPGTQLTPPNARSTAPLTTTFTVIQPTADCLGLGALTVKPPTDVGQVWIIQVDTQSGFWVQFDDAYNGTNLSTAGGGEAFTGGEFIVLIAAQLANTFQPRWQQMGGIGRSFYGPGAKGSGSGPCSGACTTVGATTKAMAAGWDTQFEIIKGMVVCCDVSISDVASNDYAVYTDVKFGVQADGTLLALSIGRADGSNAGNPPVGWNPPTPTVTHVGGSEYKLTLVANGVAGLTLQHAFFGRTVSARRGL